MIKLETFHLSCPTLVLQIKKRQCNVHPHPLRLLVKKNPGKYKISASYRHLNVNMNKTQSLIIRILPQPLSIITRPYMTNIIHVEHKCDIETTMLEIWTLMYLYNDSEWHLPITLIWESEKSCSCLSCCFYSDTVWCEFIRVQI